MTSTTTHEGDGAAERSADGSSPWWRQAPWLDVLGAWLLARLVVAGGFAVAHGIASTMPDRRFLHLDDGLVTWDGAWYASLAERGYDGSPPGGLRFFPLYHLVADALTFGAAPRVGLVLVANLCALGCLLLLHRLVVEEVGDPELARRSVWLLALFPAAGSFVFAYSESLMLLLTLGIFLLVRRERWWWVAVLGLASGLSRPVAVLLCAPLAIAALRGWSAARPAQRVARIAGTIAPAVGVAAYLWWVEVTHGDWTEPIDLQREIRKGFQDPVTRLAEGLWEVATSSQLDAPSLAFALLFVGLVVVSIRRQAPEWWLYSALTVLVAVSAPVIDSTGRYGLVAFGLIVALAQVVRSERVMWCAAGLSCAGLLGLTTMTLLGGYVP